MKKFGKLFGNRSHRSNSPFLFTTLVAITGLIVFSCSNSSNPVVLPALDGTVTISGSAQVGAILTAHTDALGGSGAISYQWKRGDTVVGDNSNTYIVQTADVGSTITVTVTRADNSGGVTSAPTAVIVAIGEPTPDLDFTLINDGTAYEVSKGEASATVVVIPPVYEGLPVTGIASNGYSGYTDMTSIIIPSSVTSIGDGAFSGCDGLTTVYYGGTDSAAWGNISIGAENTPLTNANIYYYSETDPGTANTHWHYVDGVPVVWYGSTTAPGSQGLAFALIDGGTAYEVSRGTATDAAIVIPAVHEGLPVTRIADVVGSVWSSYSGGFAGYTDMTSITIPNSVTSIGDYAFFGCSGLTSVTIPSSMTSIGQAAFNRCSGLISLTIPNSVTSIGASAFSFCSGLTSVTVASDNTVYRSEGNCLIQIANNTLIRGCKNSVVPNGVTSIGDGAFSGCSGLTSVTIPNSVTSIGDSAFSNCSGLTSITIGNGVTSIGDGAFYACSGLISVTIPNGVTSIGWGTFSWCSSLTSVTIGNNVTYIGGNAFEGCSGLTSITIPNGVTSIGEGAFSGCRGLWRVYYGGTDSTVWENISIDNSNYELTNATYFYYYSEVSKAGNYWRYVNGVPEVWDESAIAPESRGLAFALIDGGTAYEVSRSSAIATAIVIPATYNGLPVTGIAEYGFSGYTDMTGVTIPNGVTSIGDNAFSNCSGLTSVTIGNGVTSIGDWAFYDCSGLTSVTIGNSVTSIGDGAFSGCSGLTSITIGNGVTSIGDYAFLRCRGLTSITVASGNTVYRSEGNCVIRIADNTLIIGCKNSVIPNGVTSIGDSAFSNCSGLTSVTIPNGVTSIGDNAFSNCSDLTSVTIGNGVTSIGDNAFSGCYGLTSVTIPNSVTSIGDWAFSNCSGLTSVTIGNGVTSIGDYAFSWCDSLTSVTIGNNVTYIGGNAFEGCSGLTSVTIPNSVTRIGRQAFEGCDGLTRVFYGGADNTAWGNISIYSRNEPLTNATRYYYSETNPGSGNYWHYVGGVPTVW